MLLLSLHVLLIAWPISAMRTDHCLHYNASGSVSVPLPQPPNSSPSTPSGNYTLSTYLSFNPASPSHEIHQKFVATNTNGDPLGTQKFDFEGCLLVLAADSSSVSASNNYINKPTESSCSAVLSFNCMSNIIESVRSAALGYSQQNRGGFGPCEQIVPASCDGVAGFTSSSFFRFQNTSTSNNCSGHTFNSDAILFGFDYYPGGRTPNAQYFKHLKGVAQPVVVVAWNKASSNGGKPWADTRLFCVTADHVVPGSESGATITKPGGCQIVLSATVALLTFIL